MIHPAIGRAIADEHQADLEREALRAASGRDAAAASKAGDGLEPMAIRLARADDLEALRRLVDLDADGAGTRHMLLDLTRPGASPRVLVASAGGAIVAALHLDTGHSVADPFAFSATALELQRTRSGRFGADRRRRRSSGRLASLRGRLHLRPS